MVATLYIYLRDKSTTRNHALGLVTTGLNVDLRENRFESILSEVVALKATPATMGVVRGGDHLGNWIDNSIYR